MAVSAFQDLELADEDREWDGDAAEKRVRKWADAEDGPNEKYRDAHVWYDADSKDNFTAYKLLIADVIGGKLRAVPRGVMAAGNVMQGARGGVDIPERDVNRVKSHLAKYYKKMDRTPPGRTERASRASRHWPVATVVRPASTRRQLLTAGNRGDLRRFLAPALYSARTGGTVANGQCPRWPLSRSVSLVNKV